MPEPEVEAVLCVCGHPESQHRAIVPGGCRVTIDERGGLLCGGLRPCLPWPTSGGWWWTSANNIVEVIAMSAANAGDLWAMDHDKIYKSVAEWSADYIDLPARFVKLVEQSPFKV